VAGDRRLQTSAHVRKLIFMMSVSLDGYFEGPDRDLSWQLISEELHQHFNDSLRGMSAFIEGRVNYQMMEGYWPTADRDPAGPEPVKEFAAIWRETPKIVVSRTRREVGPNATLLREIDPDEIRRMKAEPGGDMSVGGADLAATFIAHDLVDEHWLYFHPVVLGKGRRLFSEGAHLELTLLDTRRFENGVVMMRLSPAVAAG
jgi:dihydrofolate reductase